MARATKIFREIFRAIFLEVEKFYVNFTWIFAEIFAGKKICAYLCAV
jgi:hypothetical protein